MNWLVKACEVLPLLVAGWLVSRVRIIRDRLDEPDEIGPFGYTSRQDYDE